MTLNILILDMVHGGDVIAEKMIKRGHDATCVDVYGIVSDASMDDVRRSGATVLKKVPPGHYDLVISPVHCPDLFLPDVTYKERKTFHQIVGELTEDERFRIEVTGVKGKTSLCFLLSHVLSVSGLKVLMHTSREYGQWVNGIYETIGKMSIAPTSILRLPKGDHDIVVCEVSLGGSGKADISVITNLVEDYGIAADTRKASDAKSSIFSKNLNLVKNEEMDIWKKYGYELKGYGGAVRVLQKNKIGDDVKVEIDYNGRHEIDMKGTYLALQYIETINSALAVFSALGISSDAVVEGFQSFNGVPGRGEVRRDGRGWKVIERNPGISKTSVQMTLSCLNEVNALNNAVVVLDGVNRKVCDKMNIPAIKDIVNTYGLQLFFAGEEIPPYFDVVIEFTKEGYQ